MTHYKVTPIKESPIAESINTPISYVPTVSAKDDSLTTVAVRKSTRDAVNRIAEKEYNLSQDGVVRKLIDFYEQHKGSAEG